MTITGDQFTAYLNESYLPSVFKSFYQNAWFLGGVDSDGQMDYSNSPFTVVPAGQCPGGKEINHMIDYASTSNAGAYTRGDAMKSAETLSSIRAYHDKDYFQGTAKVYGDTLSQFMDGFDPTVIAISPIGKAIDNSMREVFEAANAQILTDLAAQVDATTAYSDAALARATYGIASQETSVSGSLTLAAMEDLVEGAENTTYGPVDRGDLVWLMPRNQLTNLSRLGALQSNAPLQTLTQDPRGADYGRVFRTQTFEGVPIFVVPGMTSTEIYLIRKSMTKIFMHKEFESIEKNPDEWAMSRLNVLGVNLVVEDMVSAGKLTGVTA